MEAEAAIAGFLSYLEAERRASRHTIDKSGIHTLRVWMVTPGVVVERIVMDAGGVRPSYLGPPESQRIGAAIPVN